MTIYISGKISGLLENEVKEKFEKAFQTLKGAGYTVVSPYALPHIHNKTWESYMKEDIAALLKCDCIYMLNDWKDSKGAVVEYELAKLLKIEVLYENE